MQKHEAEPNMQRAVEQHLDANTTIIAAVPGFQAASNQLKAFNAHITALVGGQEAARTGISADKQAAEAAQSADIKLCTEILAEKVNTLSNA